MVNKLLAGPDKALLRITGQLVGALEFLTPPKLVKRFVTFQVQSNPNRDNPALMKIGWIAKPLCFTVIDPDFDDRYNIYTHIQMLQKTLADRLIRVTIDAYVIGTRPEAMGNRDTDPLSVFVQPYKLEILPNE